MTFSKHQLTKTGSTALFVLLWSSGGIFSAWGLKHATPLAFLTLRFTVALIALGLFGLTRGELLPVRGTRLRVIVTGAFICGGYSICYLIALGKGATPGTLAVILGIQPILTLLLFERRLSTERFVGLALAMSGLFLVVYQDLDLLHQTRIGTCFALGALACVTTGAILQKGIDQPPLALLPLQYTTSLFLCVAAIPYGSFSFECTTEFLVPLLWLGLVISVVAQLLLYNLIRSGDLVNVTSLFYLVPPTTAALDFLLLGHSLPALTAIGMVTILAGLLLIFRARVKASA